MKIFCATGRKPCTTRTSLFKIKLTHNSINKVCAGATKNRNECIVYLVVKYNVKKYIKNKKIGPS